MLKCPNINRVATRLAAVKCKVHSRRGTDAGEISRGRCGFEGDAAAAFNARRVGEFSFFFDICEVVVISAC